MLREVVPHVGLSDADPPLVVRHDAGEHTGHRFADRLDAVRCTAVPHVAAARIVALQAGSSSAAPHTAGRHIADRASSLMAKVSVADSGIVPSALVRLLVLVIAIRKGWLLVGGGQPATPRIWRSLGWESELPPADWRRNRE
jgi:hypothetical protein